MVAEKTMTLLSFRF